MSSSARVSVTLTLNSKSHWGDQCTIAQVKQQAFDEVKAELQRLAQLSKYRLQLVGDPVISVVTTE